jgi:diguanylate cyclase (GGDEF)-like protein/PAS domain S-box-containing protein
MDLRTDGSGRADALRARAGRLSALAGMYFLAAIVGIVSSQQPDSIASIWIANALALAFLLRTNRRDWPAGFLAVFVAGLAANMVMKNDIAASLAMTGANLVEIGLGLFAARAWLGPAFPSDLGIVSYLKLQSIAVLAAPALGGLVGAVALNTLRGAEVGDVWLTLWGSSAIGAITVLPVALMASRDAVRSLVGARALMDFTGLAVLSGVVTYLAVASLSHPFVIVALSLVFVAMRVNPFGTALIAAASVVVATGATLVAAAPASGTLVGVAVSFFAPLAVFPSFCLSLIVEELRREQSRIGESEQRFRNAMEHSAIGMALVGLDGRWLKTNRALSEMLGYGADEFASLTFQDITHPDDLATDLGLLKETISGEIDTYRMEKRYFRKDGSLLWALLAVSLVRDDKTNAPLYFISQIADITARKFAEEAIEKSESRWNIALESAGQGVWDFDVRGNRLFYSKVWKAMLGYAAGEIGDEPDAWEKFVHPDDLDRVVKATRDHLAGLTPAFEAEFRMRHKDGHYLWMLDRGKVVMRDAHGAPLRMIGIQTDITSRKKTEAALAASESRWQFALESARQGVWDYDVTAGKTFYSSVWKEILGYRGEEIDDDAQAWWTFVHPDDVAAVRVAGQDHVANQTPYFECEFRMRHKDGHWVWILDRGKVVERDADGKPLRMLGTHTDITARKETEERLRRLSERIQLAVKSGGVGLWERNLDTGKMWWDGRMLEIYGLDPATSEITYDLWAERLHPEDRQRVEGEVRDGLAGIRPYDTEFRVITPAGAVRYVRTMANLTRKPDGSPALLSGTNWETTETRLLTDALSKEKELLQVTLQSIGDAVITTDTTANITFMNPVAEELTGWKAEEAMGKPVAAVIRIVDEATDGSVDSPVDECMRLVRPISRHENVVLIGRDGERRDIRESAAPVRTAAGEVIGAVLVFQDMTRSRQLQRQLAHSAAHDALTGLPNRTTFEAQLAATCADARVGRRQHALCFIDLDRFKIVNDTVGHAAGDALLREIGRVIMKNVRADDVTARLGGDEFALILRHCSIEQAERVAGTVIEAIRAIPFAWGGRIYDVGASIGMTAISENSPVPSELLSQADVACYTAKAMGRNRVSVYEPGESDAHRHHRDLQVAANIRGAIEQNHFRLYAQEIRSLKPTESGSRHIELLLRLDDNGKIVEPASFIPAAERYDLMANIDRWVVRTALGTYGDRIRAERDLSIAINLSANSLNDPLFWPFLQDELKTTRVLPNQIHLEITETALINNLSAAHALVSAARAAGCAIVLDDFGTGLSSFAYLKRFPVDYVKIDGTFMQSLKESGVDRAIVESINDIAHKLGARTVAECVEDAEAIEILRMIGVDEVQGFAISRPMPIEAFLAPRLRAVSAA